MTEKELESTVESHVLINGQWVPVYLPKNMDRHDLFTALNSPQFDGGWRASLDPRFKIRSILFQSVDVVGPSGKEKFLFGKLKADVTNPEGKFLPGIVFMRGGAVVILEILVCGGKEYAVMVTQPRFAVGSYEFPENPAGMLDGSGDVVGKAIQELEEEAGIKVKRENLIDLTELAYGDKWKGVYTTAGACDEFLRILLDRREVNESELQSLQGRLGGLAEEGEEIRLQVVPLEEVPFYSPAAGSLAAYCLYKCLKWRGTI